MDNGNLHISHLAWCGLIALHTARYEGTVSSPAQENLFLTRWLATAEKQRRFRRELASDIRWLLNEGRKKGMHADLPGKLEYLWRAGNGNLLEQNDLFRLQHALHSLKIMGWVYLVLSENEWSCRNQLKTGPSVQGIYLSHQNLNTAFDHSGLQVSPLEARITGDINALDALLQRSGWRREQSSEDEQLHTLSAKKQTSINKN